MRKKLNNIITFYWHFPQHLRSPLLLVIQASVRNDELVFFRLDSKSHLLRSTDVASPLWSFSLQVQLKVVPERLQLVQDEENCPLF